MQFRGSPLTISRVLHSIRARLDRQPINGCRGVFSSFEEASRAAPPIKPLGYESANSAGWYMAKMQRLALEDYPAIYWLREAFGDSNSVLEIGGHVGEAFYSFSRVLEYPANLRWTILDVPSIAEAGQKLAREKGARLEFISSLSQTQGAEILFAAGALQYFEPPTLVDWLSSFAIRPRHVIINVTPVSDAPTYVTLQNLGSVYCPYRIFNRTEFVGALERFGYQLVDSWHQDRRFRIPGHPEKSFDHYSGFYFRKQ